MAVQTKAPPTGEAALGARAWSRWIDDPRFHDLPFKIETNARGQLLLTYHKIYHSDLQGDIILLLASDEHGPSEEGRPRPEYAVYTSDGVKVPDVVWISNERAAEIPEGAEASPVMPEICIEVLSRSNTKAEMDEKRHLFFEGGAEEVWIVSADGHVTFYDAKGTLNQSRLAPDFPAKIDV